MQPVSSKFKKHYEEDDMWVTIMTNIKRRMVASR
jgi:hypothetical protein